MKVQIIDLEAHPDGCIGFGAREKRERLQIGMFARLHFRVKGERRVEKLWVKVIASSHAGDSDHTPAYCYRGELIDEGLADELATGAEFVFAPEHVCEWTAVRP